MQALAYTWLLIIMMCSTPASLKAAVNNEDSSEEKHKVAEILPTLFKLVHCPEERSVVVNSEVRNSSVTWPQVISSSAKSSKRVASDPLCISPEGDLITRFCVKKSTLNNPIWDPPKPPECFRSQPSYDNVDKCPLPYKDLSIHGRHFCVLITEPREWAPACESGVTDEDILDLSMSEFTSLVDYFRRIGVTSVWLPVKRFGNYGPLLRRLPGEEYGDKFKMPYHLLLSWSPNQQPLRGECLKLNIPFDINSAVTLGSDDCNHKYPVACVYKPSSDMLVRLACPEHYFTSRYSNEQDRCLSVSKNNIPVSWEEANLKCFEKGGHLMKISSVQDNYLAEEIINDFDCKDGWIGARRKSSDKGYEWHLGINNSVEVGFVNWDPKLSFGEIVDGRGALNEHGFWALYNRTYKLKCSICETKIEIPRTELSLRHDPEANRLTLSVYSPKGLWKESEKEEGVNCFTDASGDFISQVKVRKEREERWTMNDFDVFKGYINSEVSSGLFIDVHKSIYFIKENNNAGNYWCVGHSLSPIEEIYSKSILTYGRKPGHLFSLILDVFGLCNSTTNTINCDPTFSNEYKSIAKLVEKRIKLNAPKLSVSNVRPMKILNVMNDGTVRLILHVRIKIKKSLKETFIELRNAVRNFGISQNDLYALVSLRSTEGCTSSVTIDGSKFLHWEFTKFGITSVPNELCLDQYGIPVHRRCSGSFLTGGMWEEPIGSCNDTMISFSTHALHSLAMGNETLGDVSTSNIAQGISKLSVNYSNLIPADVYYLALVMKNLARLSNESQTSTDDMFELEALTNIIDYVNEADRETVALSQMYLNSTNILLDALNELLNLICMNANITKNNGVILSVTSQVIVQISDPSLANITGLALARKKHSNYVSTEKYKSFKDYDIVPLKSDQTLEPIMQSDEIEVATWVPNELLTEITNENFNFSSFYDPEINETVTIEPSYLLKGRKPYIVIVVLYKDVLFYEASRVRSQRRTTATNQSREANSDDDQDEVNIVGSRVISVSIPGIGSDLPVPIPIVFKPLLSSLNKPSNQRTCAFWDFSFNSSTPSQSLGGWSGDGCVYAGHSLQGNEKGKNGLEVCVCTHLTHFAELILGPSAYRTLDKSKISDPNIQYLLRNEKALDIISIVGCTLSLFGVIGIVTTAAVFRSWRDKSGTKILLQLSLAIALQMLGYLLSNFNTRNKHTAIPIPEEEVSNYENNEIVSCPEGSKIAGDLMNYSYDDITICDPYLIDGEENIFCIILAAFNHYAILCGFSWMLVTAFLQFQRYVKVLGCTRPPRFLLKSTLFGWGIPLIPVCVMLMITPYSYVPSYHTTMCHLTGKSLYLGVILPASMFIFVNLFVFVKVIDSVLRGPDGKVRSNPDRNLVYSQLRLGVVLFFLLGLSWVFGIILSLNPNTIIFSYLFCLTATTQGFVMFLFFVVCDPSTRHLWIKLVSTWGKIACGLTFNTGEKLSNSNVSDSFRNIDTCPKKEATKKQELSYEKPVADQTPVNDKKNSVQQNSLTDKKGWNDAKY